jgi:large subunit ribosomal protein L5
MNDLAKKYQEEIVPTLIKEFDIKSRMQVPRLKKIVINCGMGEALTDKKVIEKMALQIGVITGQKPQVTHAKVSISTFKLREGEAIGLKVTLRRVKMYDFLRRFTSVALPRVRDFRGIPLNGFDSSGNYTLGLKEQTIFPELEYQMVDKTRGFEITFVTSTNSSEQAKRLLELLGLPFEKHQ